MPGYRTHMIAAGGVYAMMWLIATYALKQSVSPVLAGLSVLCGALFPDYDIKSMSRYMLDFMLIPVSAICWVYGKYAPIVGIVIVRLIAIFSPHRGIMHRLWFSIMCLMLACMYALRIGVGEVTVYWTGAFFLAGFISHIVLDRCMYYRR